MPAAVAEKVWKALSSAMAIDAISFLIMSVLSDFEMYEIHQFIDIKPHNAWIIAQKLLFQFVMEYGMEKADEWNEVKPFQFFIEIE